MTLRAHSLSLSHVPRSLLIHKLLSLLPKIPNQVYRKTLCSWPHLHLTSQKKMKKRSHKKKKEESDGRLTPPVGFVLSSDGRVHGDTSMVQDNPMLAMIMNAMSGVLAQKRLEEHEDEMERKGKGKGKVGAKGAEGNGYDAGTGSSSSITAPMSKPKAKSKSKSMAKKGKIGKKH